MALTTSEWTVSQWDRILMDMTIITSEMPGFELHNGQDPDQALIVGSISSLEYRYDYRLALYLYPDFPFEMPRLFLHRPSPLYQINGNPLPEKSHDFHTLTSINGKITQICHDKPELWNPWSTLLDVLMKGQLWIMAYERHLSTGMTIEEVYKNDIEWRIRS